MPIPRVLIVDDDPNVLSVLGELLAELGYAPRGASSGPDALRLIAEFEPDIVLLDLAMPDVPGEVVLEQLQRTRPDVPVIMVTGNDDPQLARTTLARGAFDYVAKPFNLSRLQHVIEAAVAYRG